MPRIEPDALSDPEQVYLAATVGEARRIEALLTARGVNYATQVEVFGRSSLFGSLRHGAGFYVTAAQAEYCRDALAQAGFFERYRPRRGQVWRVARAGALLASCACASDAVQRHVAL